jgi:large subunit ribosomal protein L9
MKIILKQDVEALGDAGDIVEVADGYGNNYLVPRGLAMRASKGALADAEAIRQARTKRAARNLAEAEEQRRRLEAAPVRIVARAGADGTLYGSVGNTAIANAVFEQRGIQIDRRRISISHPLKRLGTHEISIRLHPELTATIQVEVVKED